MGKNLYCKIGYAITQNYQGIVDWHTEPACIIIEDLWLLRGYACFEVIEAKGTIVFHMEDHLDRLVHSMEALRLPPPPITGELHLELKSFLRKAIQEVFVYNHVNNKDTFLIRIYVTGGSTLDSFHPSSPPNIFIYLQPYSMPKFVKNLDQGIKLFGVDHLQEFPQAKTVNYCKAEVMSPWVAGVKHCDDIFYFYNNYVLEGSTFNLFVVKNGIIRTSEENILHGVTRKIVIELAKKRGYKVEERRLPVFSLRYMDEVFVTSTTKGVWPVVELRKDSEKPVMLPEGCITLELRKAFQKYRRDYYNKQKVST